MASEITYAEVKFKNQSPAPVVKGKEWTGYLGERELEGAGLKKREWRFFLLWLWFLPDFDGVVQKRS